MSFSASLRRCAAPSRVARQEASSTNATASSSSRKASKNKNRRQHTLPREKLRALVSLYHQADTFITPENLVEKIDEALLKNANATATKPPQFLNHQMVTPGQLWNVMERRKTAPPMTDMNVDLKPTVGSASVFEAHWSSVTKAARERRVIEALYGLNMASSKGTRPGLEAVEAAIPKLEEELAETKKA